MLYEVITSVLVYPEFKAIIDSLNMVNAIRAWPNENTDCIVYPNPAGNIVYINRITSYNVCYTKLLRNWSDILFKFSGKKFVECA